MATRVAARENSTTKTIIDHVYTDITRFDYNFSIQDTSLSDHRMILLSFNTNLQTTNNSDTYLYKKINFNKFRNLLVRSGIFNSSFTDMASADECLEAMKAQLAHCTDTKTKSFSNSDKPWINNELLTAISDRDRYFRLHKKFPTNFFIAGKYKMLKKEAEKNGSSLEIPILLI